MINCISCGNPIINTRVNCPHCGYRFTAGDDLNCPNKEGSSCIFTNEICTQGMNFMRCPIKAEEERKAEF